MISEMLCEVNFKKINKIYKEQFMKDGKSIVLIGMPGVGKSTIGVILAKEVISSLMQTFSFRNRKECC